jgi:soluble lytic murein transglycosylase
MRFRIFLAILILIALSSPSPTQTLEARDAFQRGYKLLEEGKYYASINHFKISIADRAYPLLDYAYFYVGRAYQQRHNYEEALQVYEIVLKHFKSSVLAPKAMFETAQINGEKGAYASAEAILREFIVQYPGHELIPEARFLLGMTLENEERFVDAARAYQNLDLLHPDNDFAEKALARLDRLAQKSPLAGYEAPAASIYNLGIKYFNRGNYAKAKEYFSRITRFYKKSSFYDEATIMLGRVELRKGKANKAVRYFEQAVNLNKDSKPEAMYYLAVSYTYLDSPRAATPLLEKIVEQYPNSHSADKALYTLGRYYKQLGEQAQALQAYEKLASAYPDSEYFSDALWHIGNLYYKQGSLEAAYENFSRAFKLPPEKASDLLIFWSGKCADKLGRREEAILAYKTTVQRFDHSYYGYRAREELKKYGIQLDVSSVPDVSEIIENIGEGSPETISHEEKYRELIALELGDEAAEEASFLEEKVPVSQKDTASIAKYHAYVMKGKYAKPIWFADRKIEESMLAGNFSEIDPRLWRFSYPRGYWSYVEKYSKMYDLDPYLVYAVIREESRFKSQALSRSWAHGLMQIIPSTGRKLSRALGISYSRWKLYNPRVNIQMGSYFLAELIKRFDGNISLALAGYNGGPVRVSKWLKNYGSDFDIDEFVEDIPISETRNYVKKVIKSYYGYKRTYSGG